MNNLIARKIQDIRTDTKKVLRIIFGINSLVGLIVVVIITGFYLNAIQTTICKTIIDISIIIYVVQELIYFLLDIRKEKTKKTRRIKERILALLLLSNFFFRDTILGFFVGMFPEINILDITLIYLGILQLTIIISYIFDFLRDTKFSKIKIHPGAITALSFGLVILIGAGLLCMPKSVHPGQSISFIDALFTSTSSVCVTGLSTITIAEHFSIIGKVIILLLIQIGGIGVMTLSAFLAAILLGGLSFRMNVMLRDMLSEDNLGKITTVLKQISIFTFSVEFVGAVLMYFSLNNVTHHTNWFYFDSHNLASAIFHSISSFCNAGLSIYPKDMMNPIIYKNYFFLGTSMALILIGGIGFLAFHNLFGYLIYRKNKRLKKIRRLNSTTKLIFLVSSIMIVVGGSLIFITDTFSNSNWMKTTDRLFYSIYIVISAKTAGFAPIQITQFTNFSVLIIIIEMWIGASPGSTGGGIRNTTIGLLLLHLINYLRGKDNLHFGQRRIDPLSIQKAQIVFFATAIMTIISTVLLVLLEPSFSIIELAFEAISAISTTGLTLGITDRLESYSKYVLIGTMYIGRIGVITFLFAFFKEKDKLLYEYPNEKVII
jgi:Trk-type K+ transport system membrane component